MSGQLPTRVRADRTGTGAGSAGPAAEPALFFDPFPTEPSWSAVGPAPEQAQVPAPSPPRPPGRIRRAVPWLIGSLVLVAAAAALAVTIVVSIPRDEPQPVTPGRYSASQVADGCDLVDQRVLERWAPQGAGTPAHHERRGSALIGGGGADCSFAGTASGRTIARAEFAMDAEIADSYGASPYGSWIDTELRRPVPGRVAGALPGLGERAVYALDEDKTDYSHRVEYTVAAQDDNLAVKVRIAVFVDERTQLDRDDVRQACIDQVQRVFDGMRQRGV
ncbi:hypothetical protein [Skermania piniformis]|uniref:DUF3558 domain-containing protein n=1 Tax=Skermania pinensis TaxID=39122 RepID=A0ABX8SCZ8_9ACTN|nr:hypothetical protein [Skermania piniformis]QXQ14310.1 hypothetical protein KV203_02435 [Skermania piniformis]